MKSNKTKRKSYIYLIRRTRDGELFCTYGNFKEAWNRPSSLFSRVSKDYSYPQKTPFGDLLISNISCDLRYNSKDYHVIRQMAI